MVAVRGNSPRIVVDVVLAAGRGKSGLSVCAVNVRYFLDRGEAKGAGYEVDCAFSFSFVGPGPVLH